MLSPGHSKHLQVSWPKFLVKKWLKLKRNENGFNADYICGDDSRSYLDHSSETNQHSPRRHSYAGGEFALRRSNFSTGERREGLDASSGDPRYSSLTLVQEDSEVLKSRLTEKQCLRVFVGTWNVGGKMPDESIDLEEWLTSKDPVDIYVLGFQEVVPLNAGNVLGAEDRLPALRWLDLIRSTLNKIISPQNNYSSRKSSPFPFSPRTRNLPGYAMVESKQMVGIFVTVWVRGNLLPHIHNFKFSCVGRGLMGCLRNKGSISMSMRLHETTVCFVCSHLTSGAKEGHEARRNSDVSFLLKKTRFRQGRPETILEHDRVIWFGDLNYRISLSSSTAKSLLAKQDWETLLQKDELQIERNAGRVFNGWNEGKIYFAPTYKYKTNSDSYTMEKCKLGQKQRVPAWCDRILWFGKGLKQVAYVRGESRFSDHRPVHAVFSVEVDVLSRRKLTRFFGLSTPKESVVSFDKN